ncbi:MAG: carbamoyltransferase HypF [Bacteroidota bacterium]|nr:carbamoyltransferase HypF [Bacteroidota bacterium]
MLYICARMTQRLHIIIRGAVQGVGFRPFIYRLAKEIGLYGYVLNSPNGVFIEVDGEKSALDRFVLRIEKEKPPRAIINSMEFSFLDPAGFTKFEIKESKQDGEINTLILPDIAVCDDCLSEMFDPHDRRHLYPFINCTNCGPRFSIIESIPYDRPNTSMKIFEMCEDCRREYENPLERRFHAQPIACPVCGPHIELWDAQGDRISKLHIALIDAAKAIHDGKIVALKGLGGFQLLCDARNNEVVARLRERKHREEKPFALMFPNIESVQNVCEVSSLEERLILSPESPIVLLKRKLHIAYHTSHISPLIAPMNPYLGIMLPYTPLHHLLMKQLSFPVVATSGNLSEEPMCIDEYEALERLKDIADYFLVHNRPIVRQVDDSIVRIILEREMVLRRARGYAPLPIMLDHSTDQEIQKSIIAVGAHLKNTIAISKGNNVFISQHIGDLETGEAYSAFTKTIGDFLKLYNTDHVEVVSDLHPDYLSTKYAQEIKDEPQKVQHHIAHVAACRAENQVQGEALGVAWDGTGYGLDGTIWGGEFFRCDEESYERVGTFKQFRLPGGEVAIKEPRRSALGILFKAYGNSIFEKQNWILKHQLIHMFSEFELNTLKTMLNKNINSPVTSSVGRLFDAVASLVGISQHTKYEGQSAMMLEFAADVSVVDSYDFTIDEGSPLIINWKPMVEQIFDDLRHEVDKSIISAKFHNTLARTILATAKKIGENKVLLSGGCFQNAFLLERTVDLLKSENIFVYWHQRIPPNDGGISLGQIAIAMNKSKI